MDKKTFCGAPWFAVRMEWDGKYRPCCVIKPEKSQFVGRKDYSLQDSTVDQWMTSEYSQYLRKNLTEGVRLSECQRCWDTEKQGLTSTRQTTNQLVAGNRDIGDTKTWIDSYLRHNSFADYKLLMADVKLSNVCNFACAMCSPHSSSKIFNQWVNDQDSPFVKEYIKEHIKDDHKYFDNIIKISQTTRGYQHLKDILQKKLMHLKVLGGEPLLDKELLEILGNQPDEIKSRINLNIFTNGSTDLIAIADSLKGYRSIRYSVSIEGVGSTQDYIRSGSDWKIVSDNILRANKQGINLTILNTFQALNVLNIADFLIWIKQHGLKLHMTILEMPPRLSISVLPSHVRNQAAKNLESLEDQEISFSLGGSISIKQLQELILQSPDHSHLYPEFLEYVAWYEKKLAAKLRDIHPEFYD